MSSAFTEEQLAQAGLLGEDVSPLVTKALDTMQQHPNLLKLSIFALQCVNDAGRQRILPLPLSPAPSDSSQTTVAYAPSIDSATTMDNASYHPSEWEQTAYYHGLSVDPPKLLYRSDYLERPFPSRHSQDIPSKSFHSAYQPTLNSIWDTSLGEKVRIILQDHKTDYSSIQLARFIYSDKSGKGRTIGPNVIFISTYPGTTTTDDAHLTSGAIITLLDTYRLQDITIEWIEGVVRKLSGPPLLPVTGDTDPTYYVRRLLTAALGMPITTAEQEKSDAQGSVAFFFHEHSVTTDGGVIHKEAAPTEGLPETVEIPAVLAHETAEAAEPSASEIVEESVNEAAPHYISSEGSIEEAVNVPAPEVPAAPSAKNVVEEAVEQPLATEDVTESAATANATAEAKAEVSNKPATNVVEEELTTEPAPAPVVERDEDEEPSRTDCHRNPINRVLGVTNCHVLCENDTVDFRAPATGNTDANPNYVRLAGSRRFQRGLDEIKDTIASNSSCAHFLTRQIAALMEKARRPEIGIEEVQDIERACRKKTLELTEYHTKNATLELFYEEVKTGWGTISDRNIGQIDWAPKVCIDVDGTGFTKDIGTFWVDAEKFKPNFRGNVVDLGAKFDPEKLEAKFYPRNNSQSLFTFPVDNQLRIKGVVTPELLANPDTYDCNDEPCIVVMKDGNATDLTVGTYAGSKAFIRKDGKESVELAIYNRDDKSEYFSHYGDSGALVFDGQGRMVGIIHSGLWEQTNCHVTYATPAWWVLKQLKVQYPDADFNGERYST